MFEGIIFFLTIIMAINIGIITSTYLGSYLEPYRNILTIISWVIFGVIYLYYIIVGILLRFKRIQISKMHIRLLVIMLFALLPLYFLITKFEFNPTTYLTIPMAIAAFFISRIILRR